MRKIFLLSIVSAGLALAGCDGGPKSSKGFSLPDGDVAQGQATFVDLGCLDCHSIVGKDDLREGIEPIMTVPIGGKTTRLATYGQLVTSIINPTHKLSQRYMMTLIQEDGMSKMRNYNSIMTVEELINMVAFLQDQYELEEYTRTSYMNHSR